MYILSFSLKFVSKFSWKQIGKVTPPMPVQFHYVQIVGSARVNPSPWRSKAHFLSGIRTCPTIMQKAKMSNVSNFLYSVSKNEYIPFLKLSQKMGLFSCRYC